MCGICGILSFEQGCDIESGLVLKMTSTMEHRGPNDSGIYIGGQCGLGHRRLSIIDIATGQQPMMVNTGRGCLTIAFNGEIYNYLEIQRDLLDLGYIFSTKSDTEVILNAYQEWGGECVSRLRGMFSFGIWDENRKSLFLARDRMGIKPLYYYQSDQVVIFASEIKAIFASSLVESKIEHSCSGFIPFFGLCAGTDDYV